MQYTKNTVTGASTADAVVVLIDARKGVLEQTRRHLSVLQLLRVAHVIVAVNKIDLVDFSEDVFRGIEADVQQVGRELGLGSDGIADLLVIPVSALDGDNVVDRSERTPWYDGPALLEVLETLPAADELESHLESFRFPVQLVIRPQGALAPDAVAGGLDRRGVPRLPRLRRPDHRRLGEAGGPGQHPDPGPGPAHHHRHRDRLRRPRARRGGRPAVRGAAPGRRVRRRPR